MLLIRFLCLISVIVFTIDLQFGVAVQAEDVLPQSLDPRLKIELFAESPQIVTPTGIDVDSTGRVWVIESNTHFPPDDYQGHPTDRILVLTDEDHDGKADQIVVFKDGLTHSMSIAVKPVWLDLDGTKAGSILVFIATRREIFLCTDTNGDLKCDEIKSLVRLETSGNYPHNGLAGFAFDAAENLFFGFGENLGADYKIIGSDGTTFSGGGEGGNIYRCLPDGSKLKRWATGFWNPHASCFDASGHLFTLDNDPDSRPPCRLLHIVENGDYGYRFRNGRKGTHPFTAWNGEIPGTLPMVSGTGEAPSGIISYESDGLPKEYRGKLLVGSWGDHRIDKFELKQRGVSFESMPQPVIKGDEKFRPVGLAVAPDGSLYVTDWVSKEYKLHGKGRIWRVSSKDDPKRTSPSLADVARETSVEKLAEWSESNVLSIRRLAVKQLARSESGRNELKKIHQKLSPENNVSLLYELSASGIDFGNSTGILPIERLNLSDPFQLTEAIHRLSSGTADSLMSIVNGKNSALPDGKALKPQELELRQIAALLAARASLPKQLSFAQFALSDSSPSIRRVGVQWVGEEKLTQLRPDVEKVLASEPMTNELFMACLASLSLLDGVAPSEFEKSPPAGYILAIAKDESRPVSLRATALRMLSPTLKELDAKLFQTMLASNDLGLRREAVRTLQHSPVPEREEMLRVIAADVSQDEQLRADAVAGLSLKESLDVKSLRIRNLLFDLAEGNQSELLQAEAVRSLRRPHAATTPSQLLAAALSADKPSATAAVETGRRLFFRPNGAGCFKCHAVGGRGGQVGPDLTVIARTMDRKKLAESILEPSKEISPQFTSWAIETKSGKVQTGILLGEEVNGDLRLGNNLGEVFFVPFNEIETRTPLKTSIMPEKLHETLSADDFRDLISYLETLK